MIEAFISLPWRSKLMGLLLMVLDVVANTLRMIFGRKTTSKNSGIPAKRQTCLHTGSFEMSKIPGLPKIPKTTIKKIHILRKTPPFCKGVLMFGFFFLGPLLCIRWHHIEMAPYLGICWSSSSNFQWVQWGCRLPGPLKLIASFAPWKSAEPPQKGNESSNLQASIFQGENSRC